MIYFLVALSIIAAGIFIWSENMEKPLTAFFFKAVASFSFMVLFAGVLYEKTVRTDSAYFLGIAFSDYQTIAILFFLALLSGLIGDLVLGLRSLRPLVENERIIFSGIMAFASGHIFYYIALLSVNHFSFYPFLIAVVLTILVFFASKAMKLEWGKLMYPCIGYSFLIFLMIGQALVNALDFAFDSFSTCVLVGAIFFAISDLILSQIYFKKPFRKILVTINLSTYYVAQIILGLSLLFVL